MFEKIGQSAEKVVGKVSVSRRGFLGRAANLAAVVGAAVAGLAFPTETPAAPRGFWKICYYACPDGRVAKLRVNLYVECPPAVPDPHGEEYCIFSYQR